MPEATITSADASGGAAIVAAPGAGLQILVYGYQTSSDTQMSMTFTGVDGTDPIHYVAANGGREATPVDSTVRPYWTCTANTALGVTASIAGNISVTVQYEIAKT